MLQSFQWPHQTLVRFEQMHLLFVYPITLKFYLNLGNLGDSWTVVNPIIFHPKSCFFLMGILHTYPYDWDEHVPQVMVSSSDAPLSNAWETTSRVLQRSKIQELYCWRRRSCPSRRGQKTFRPQKSNADGAWAGAGLDCTDRCSQGDDVNWWIRKGCVLFRWGKKLLSRFLTH